MRRQRMEFRGGLWPEGKGVGIEMQTYEVGDKVSPFQVNKHKLWGEVLEVRRWGRGYSCHVRWDPELWRLNGKKHPQEGWYPQTKLWPVNSD